MERRAVVQIHVDPRYYTSDDLRFNTRDRYIVNEEIKPVARRSYFLSRYYAEKCGADYHLITVPSPKYIRRVPSYEKFQLFDDKWISQYDKILSLDHDMYPWKEAPNVFDLAPSDALTVSSFKKIKYNNDDEEAYERKKISFDGYMKYRGIKVKKEELKKYMWNGGLYVITPKAAISLRKYFPALFNDAGKSEKWAADDVIIPIAMTLSDAKLSYVDDKFNHCLTTNCYISHCQGFRHNEDEENMRDTCIHNFMNEKADKQIEEIKNEGINYDIPSELLRWEDASSLKKERRRLKKNPF